MNDQNAKQEPPIKPEDWSVLNLFLNPIMKHPQVCPECGVESVGQMHRSGIYIPGCPHDTKERRIWQLLREIENHCPCGARPESLNTHPHVSGCPVEAALVLLTPASTPADAPKKPLLNLSKEWFANRADLEVDHAVEAGAAPTEAPGEAGDIVARVLELDAKATPGPWISKGYGFGRGPSIGEVGFTHGFQDDCDGSENGENDAELIAFYRTACPQLARTIATLRAEWEGLRAEIAEMKAAVLMLKPMTELGIKVFNQTNPNK